MTLGVCRVHARIAAGRIMAMSFAVAVTFSFVTIPATAEEDEGLETDVAATDINSIGVEGAEMRSTGQDAQAFAQQTGEPVEVIEERTESSRTFALPDGQWLRELDALPSRVLVTGDGSRDEHWADVSTDLVWNDDGSVSPRVYVGEAWLSGGGKGPVATFKDADTGAVVTFEWDGVLPVPELDGARATYPNVFPGVDLVVDVLISGFEQYFVFHDEESLAYLEGLHLDLDFGDIEAVTTEDGGFRLVRQDGTEVGFSPTAFAWDAEEDTKVSHPVLEEWSDESNLAPGVEVSAWFVTEEQSAAIEQATRGRELPEVEALDITVQQHRKGVRVLLDVDEQWVEESGREFPLVVDPTVVLSDSSWMDTYVRWD